LKNYKREISIVVPRQLSAYVCQLDHDEITAGHLSFEKTYSHFVALLLASNESRNL
jgi:hypothetical protein